jgi:hypothetical protein
MSETKVSTLRQNLIEIKSSLVHKYFDFRINRNTNPYQILFRQTPYRFLFILGHMRAASSLLSHLLTSNPEIIGYGETHTQYHTESDLKNLMLKVYWNYYQLQNIPMQHKYILDKVLHNNKIFDSSLLKSKQVYSLFLIREPVRTISSLLDLKPDWSESKALKYYTERLAKLEESAKFIDNQQHCLLIKQEQLINNTQAVFSTLQTFLDTKTGFSEQYQVTQTTGMRYIGDQTENIKAGRIIRQKRKLDITLTADTIATSQASYQQCCQTLSDYCAVIKDY